MAALVAVLPVQVVAASQVAETGPVLQLELLSAMAIEGCSPTSGMCPPASGYFMAALDLASSEPFAPCREMALALKRKGLRRDTLLRFALSLSEPPGLKRFAPFVQYHGGEAISDAELDEYLDCLRAPERAALFKKFFASSSAELRRIGVAGASCGDAAAVTEAAAGFFGFSPERFIFAPTMLLRGRGGWGGAVGTSGGAAVYAVYGYAPGMYGDCFKVRAIARHEFSHGLLAAALKDREPASGPFMFLLSFPRMLMSGYTSSASITEEYLARAASVLLAEKAGRPDDAALELSIYRKSGFRDIDRFVGILREYDSGRDKYRDFGAFGERLNGELWRAERRARLLWGSIAGLLLATLWFWKAGRSRGVR